MDFLFIFLSTTFYFLCRFLSTTFLKKRGTKNLPFRPSVCPSHFSFLTNNFNQVQQISTKVGVCIGLDKFYAKFENQPCAILARSSTFLNFHHLKGFQPITLTYFNRFQPKLMCALIWILSFWPSLKNQSCATLASRSKVTDLAKFLLPFWMFQTNYFDKFQLIPMLLGVCIDLDILSSWLSSKTSHITPCLQGQGSPTLFIFHHLYFFTLIFYFLFFFLFFW